MITVCDVERSSTKLFLVLELLDLFVPHESLISEEELGIQHFVYLIRLFDRFDSLLYHICTRYTNTRYSNVLCDVNDFVVVFFFPRIMLTLYSDTIQ